MVARVASLRGRDVRAARPCVARRDEPVGHAAVATVEPAASDVAGHENDSCQLPHGEWRRLWFLIRRGLTHGRRPWIGVALALATALIYVAVEHNVFAIPLWRAGDVYAALPLGIELARLPMSLFLATPYLPLWAACLQLLVVFGLGELIIGRRLTLLLGLLGHFLSTLCARVLLVSLHVTVLGLSPALVHVLDTGPSGATTAVGTCLLVVTRMYRSAVLLAAALVIAGLVMPGVDGVEHVSAMVFGAIAGIVLRVTMARSRRRNNAVS